MSEIYFTFFIRIQFFTFYFKNFCSRWWCSVVKYFGGHTSLHYEYYDKIYPGIVHILASYNLVRAHPGGGNKPGVRLNLCFLVKCNFAGPASSAGGPGVA
jgi:hypothetical protein